MLKSDISIINSTHYETLAFFANQFLDARAHVSRLAINSRVSNYNFCFLCIDVFFTRCIRQLLTSIINFCLHSDIFIRNY